MNPKLMKPIESDQEEDLLVKRGCSDKIDLS